MRILFQIQLHPFITPPPCVTLIDYGNQPLDDWGYDYFYEK